MSADGKIASAGREVTTFGSPRDLEHLYELRATADAILCGARTIEETGATLGNGGEKFRRRRLKAGLAEYPIRVVISGRATLSSEAAIWKSENPSPIIVFTTRRSSAANRARLLNLASMVCVSEAGEIDFAGALQFLADQYGVRRVLSEGGAEVNAALFREKLVDEINLTICPLILGGRTAPTIAEGAGVERLAEAEEFELARRRQIGQEMFLVYRRRGTPPTPKTRRGSKRAAPSRR